MVHLPADIQKREEYPSWSAMYADEPALESVISNEQLAARPARAADREGQRQALEALAQELEKSPARVLQSLSDAAMRLCRAHSAGISLVEEEDGRHFFRWHAVSGRFAPYLWSTLPRDFSPCGTVLDRGAPQLMVMPERYFTPLLQISPKVFEVLLIPFAVGEVIAGTVWVVAHDDTRRFDSEDRRVVTSLAKFAAVAYAGLASLSVDDVVRLARLSKARSVPRELPVKSIQRHVLIVDRDTDAAEALAGLLRGMGHQVQVARDASHGLELSRSMRPDLVLLQEAGRSRHRAARELRQVLGAEVRIVAVGGDADILKGLD